MALIQPELWVPAGVDSLEPAASRVVQSCQNALVTAGPGAGKTELLAQRACFLLDTGTCKSPYRILAISFKRDAAKNLSERVRTRCGDRAQRFDSFTLDAFAKGLVDRFRLSLPKEWRPKADYEVMVRSPDVNRIRAWLKNVGLPTGHSGPDISHLPDGELKRRFETFTYGSRLPYDSPDVDPLDAHFGRLWWQEQLTRPAGQESLMFPMLNRLAAYLLRSNPKLTQALRTTYTHVFLDEFQDTTASQYDLVRAAFLGSESVLTAVGDSKQRIMVWAGAMTEVFDTYMTDFEAVSHELVRNYRSAPELVQMQQVIAMAIEADAPQAQAAKVDASGSCSILEFKNPKAEAEYVAELIASGLRDEDMKPRDFCIIVRQRTGEMVETLKKALSKRDIRLRDESQLQDLLIEPVVHFLLAVLRLSTRNRDAEAWDILTSTISMLLGLDENADTAQIEKRCVALVQHARETLTSGQYVEGLLTKLIEMVGEAHFRAVYGQYRTGAFLNSTINNFADELQVSMGAFASAREAVDDLVGVDVVPAMTIHKSKGLEFHTVIFLGLEDSQWWSFRNQPDEEKRGFFVAFSRAIERVYFTYSDVRDERWGRRPQGNSSINELYEILRRAGVPTVDCR